MGLFSSSKKKADLPPEKKHCATIVDLAATDAEQGSEWKFEKSRFDVDGRLSDVFTYDTLDNDSSMGMSGIDDSRAILSLSTVVNKNVLTIGRILKNLTDKVDKVLAQNKELQERCEVLENKAGIQRR